MQNKRMKSGDTADDTVGFEQAPRASAEVASYK